LNTQRSSVSLLAVTVISLIVAGIVVLLLHVVAVGGIYAFNRIQAAHKEPATQSSSPSSSAGSPATTGFYTVKKGDTPTSIAHSFGLTAEELLKANRITDPKKLQPGQTLKVPPRKS
jgi:LysM repeat protein